ncbi:MAG TPA: porin, partial [Gammaproteobacteria bacterium]|nr:porin [Gammaproteobacteria bacterium]
MQQKIKSVFSKLALSLLLPACVYAAPTGAPVASDGGLQVSSTKGPFWFNISGVAKLDSRSYFDDTDTTQSGLGQLGTYLDAVFIRDLGLAFEGGIGENYTYTIEFNFDAPARTATIDYAYLTYLGFGDLLPHLSFSLGQVVPGFCLNCASSSKWTPFMERSMATNTFGPQAGIGINGNTYNDHYSATVAITQQPRAGIPIVNVYGQPINTHDRWQGSARLTWHHGHN